MASPFAMAGGNLSLKPISTGGERIKNWDNSSNINDHTFSFPRAHNTLLDDSDKQFLLGTRPNLSTRPIQVIVKQLSPQVLKTFKEVLGENTIEKVVKELEFGGELWYSVRFENRHTEELSFDQLITLEKGKEALQLFQTKLTFEDTSQDNFIMMEMRKNRKRTSALANLKSWDDITLDDSDEQLRDEVPKKRVRRAQSYSPSESGLDGDQNTSADDTSQEVSSNDSKLKRSEKNGRDNKGQRQLRTRKHTSYAQREFIPSLRLSTSDESDDFENDYENLYSNVGRNREQRHRREPAPIHAEAKLVFRTGSRRSQRVRKSVNMKEVDLNDPWSPESDNISPPKEKVIGAKEVFKPLANEDSFRNRHFQVCETCGNANDNAGILVYCQGCSLAYHKNCLGNRGGREHLVTKVAEDNFVLQCRRCINFPRRKDITAPNHSMCQECKVNGKSCIQFRSRMTAAQEQRERENNNGVDPIADVVPSLINNPSNVLFRCMKCWRPFHYRHLTLLNDYSSAIYASYSEDEWENLRYLEYAQDWKCKDCLQFDNKIVESIVAWRPVDLNNYVPNTAVALLNEDDVEYLIKWKDCSYFQVFWMPGAWVWGVTARGTRKSFVKKNTPMKSTTEAAIPEEYLRIDIVLNVKYTGAIDIRTSEIDRANVTKVNKALIKYKGLGYEDVVWETVPKPKDGDRWTDFVTAYNDWVLGQYTHLPELPVLKLRVENVRAQKFIELENTKQPRNITGGKLMKYQLDGLNWIYHQWHKQHNGILADEMGLGKTIQVISFLAMMIQDHNCYPFLVVVPNSTCPNWRREIKQWAPSLRVVAYYGSSAARQVAYNYELYSGVGKARKDLRCHIVVTSYEAASDGSNSQFFKNVPWQGLIVDEGQRLKNDKSILNNTLASWKIPFRLLLSGTPLQNNARELFNLLQFLDNSINADEMENEFSHLSKDKILKLHNLIRPYILRRTKAQVLTFLPPMAQIIVPVSMTVIQKKLYKSILAKSPALLRALFNSTSLKAQERANLNNLLMQLRKCLCHPFVYSQHIEERNLPVSVLHRNLVEASSKLQLLEVLLPKLKEHGHRVLIFSQFLDMLNIIEDFLNMLDMRYQRLDGNVNSLEKQKRIDEFNALDSPLFAFLLSTRAGGVGINLATADTVIILDPDFNPHQDMQALSRAHRIGQTKKVLCFKLMTRPSVEERIVQIGRKKLALDNVVVKQLDAEDLENKDVESILRHGAAALFSDEEGEKDIRYDSASIDLLLDRSQIENTKGSPDKSTESQFGFTRVWANNEEKLEDSLELSEHESPPDLNLWERIIREREREASKEAATHAVALGRGKRTRMMVDYNLNGDHLTQEEREAIYGGDDEVDQGVTPVKPGYGKTKHDSDTDFRAESDGEQDIEDFGTLTQRFVQKKSTRHAAEKPTTVSYRSDAQLPK